MNTLCLLEGAPGDNGKVAPGVAHWESVKEQWKEGDTPEDSSTYHSGAERKAEVLKQLELMLGRASLSWRGGKRGISPANLPMSLNYHRH